MASRIVGLPVCSDAAGPGCVPGGLTWSSVSVVRGYHLRLDKFRNEAGAPAKLDGDPAEPLSAPARRGQEMYWRSLDQRRHAAQ